MVVYCQIVCTFVSILAVKSIASHIVDFRLAEKVAVNSVGEVALGADDVEVTQLLGCVLNGASRLLRAA